MVEHEGEVTGGNKITIREYFDRVGLGEEEKKELDDIFDRANKEGDPGELITFCMEYGDDDAYEMLEKIGLM